MSIEYIKECLKTFVPKQNIELEWKLQQKDFSINIVDFRNIDYHLTNLKLSTCQVMSLDINYVQNGVNYRIQLDNENNIKEFYKHNICNYTIYTKNRITSVKNEDYNINFTCSEEQIKEKVINDNKIFDIISTNKIDVMRLKYRKTFTNLDDNIKYDLTLVKQMDVNNVITDLNKHNKFPTEKYEVEMEIINSNVNIDYQVIYKNLKELIIGYQNTTYITTNSVEKQICSLFFEKFKDELKRDSLPKVKNFNVSDIEKLSDNYYISEKTDGIHSFLGCFDNDLYLLNYNITSAKFIGTIGKHFNDFILEGEFISTNSTSTCTCTSTSTSTNNNSNIFKIFDVLLYNNASILKLPFIERIKIVTQNNITDMTGIIIDDSKEQLIIEKKVFYIFKKDIEILQKPEKDFDEGIIFVQNKHPSNMHYIRQNILKWKKQEALTIDFLVREQSVLNKLKYKTYELLVTQRTDGKKNLINFVVNNIKQLYLCPLNVKLINNCVYEFNYDKTTNEWNLLKFRDEKSRNSDPNAVLTATGVWNTIINSIKLSDINQRIVPKFNYYVNKKINDTNMDKELENMAKYNRLVIKQNLYEYAFMYQFKIGKKDIKLYEIGYGQGGDINRWNTVYNKKFQKISIYGTDPSVENKPRLIERLKQYQLNPNCNFSKDNNEDSYSNFKIANFTNVSLNDPVKYNIISAQFSIHYTLNSFNNSIKDLINYVCDHLEQDGIFIATTLNTDLISQYINERKYEPYNNVIVTENSLEVKNGEDILWKISQDDKLVRGNIYQINKVKIPSVNIHESQELDEYHVSSTAICKAVDDLNTEGKQIELIEINDFKLNSKPNSKIISSTKTKAITYESIHESLKSYVDLNMFFVIKKL